MRKRKGQYYIQTWHSSICLKKIERDAIQTLSKAYISSALQDSKMIDLFVSGSEWRTNNILNSFWYSGNVFKCNLYIEKKEENSFLKKKADVHDFYKLDDRKKILLYAPTFRKNKSFEYYDVDYALLKTYLSEKFGGDWVIIVRFHSAMDLSMDPTSYSKDLLNGSIYPQINDLIVASDFFMTDYSSTIFEGFRLKKKVIVYASDYHSYMKDDRGVYFDIKELPSLFAENMEDLKKVIFNFDEKKYNDKVNAFGGRIGYYENCLVDKLIEKIRDVLSS